MTYLRSNRRGVSLIELLVGLVIFAIVMGGIYRLFTDQNKAYTVQDQVAEVQQSIRTAMEVLLKDLRMTGFDDDSRNSKVSSGVPLLFPLQDGAIAVSYEFDPTHRHTVVYSVDGNSRLVRQLTVTPDAGTAVTTQEVILENVGALSLTYGVDRDGIGNEDGAVDFWASGPNVRSDWRVVAVRVTLTARPEQPVTAGDDRFNAVTPRTLTSVVTMRNLALTT